jgi:hypothetical protein
MGIESAVTDGILHFSTGIVISLVDYTTYRIVNPKEKRIEKKQEFLTSLDKILEAQEPKPGDTGSLKQVNTDSVQYAIHVEAAKRYLKEEGLIKYDLNLFGKIREFIHSLIHDEKINNLSNPQKLGVAVGLEIVYDSLFGFNYYTQVVKESPIAALSRNIYQVPLLFSGLWVGHQMRNAVDWLSTSSEERKLNKIIRKSVKVTPIVDMVLNYKAPENIKEELADHGFQFYATQMTRSGKSIYHRFLKYAQEVSHSTAETARYIANYGERKRQEEAEQKEKRLARFQEITKGK